MNTESMRIHFKTVLFFVVLFSCSQSLPTTNSQEVTTKILERLAHLEDEVRFTQQENADLKQRMKHYDEKHKLLEHKYTELKNYIKKASKDHIKELHVMKMKHDAIIQKLQDRMGKQMVENTEIKQHSVDNITKKVGTGEVENRPLGIVKEKRNKKDDTNKNVNEITTEKQGKANNTPQYINKRAETIPIRSTVAFSAFATKHLQHLAPGHIIDFQRVGINEGNGYDKETGIFTCPMSGLYLFSFNILLYTSNQRIGADLRHNGNHVLSAYKATVSPEYNGNAPATTVLRLNVGDRVWVAVYASDSYLYGADQTNFMGVCISE